jgi:secreted trypsin-like serine protease
MKTLLTILLTAAAFGVSAQSVRIVGGGNATAGAYPYMTALIEKGATPSSGQFCGAALVAPQWVLTAAHCMEGTPASSVEVWIGGRDLRNANEGVRVAVSQVIMHPNYGENAQGALVNDFCLLKLSRAVTERATIPLVETAAQIAAGITSRAVGWGATSEGGSGSSILQQVDLPLVSLATAGGSAAGLGSTHLAAGRVSGGIDTCQGDSGGPLMVRNSAGAWAHAGTVSYGNGCARPGEYGIYGNTLTLKPWIQSYIGGGTTPTDDHSNTTTNASTLAMNGTATGNLEAGGDADVFKVMITGPGTLVVNSTGGTDVVGALLGSTGSSLLTDDNGAGSPNFRLTRTLTAATTLYVKVTGKTTSTTGAYGLSTSFTATPVGAPDIALRLGTTNIAMNGSVAYGARPVNGTALNKTFTIANTGKSALAINGVSVTSGSGFSLSTQPASSIAAGKTTSFIVAFTPPQSGSLSATLSIESNDPDENPYIITLTGSGTGGTTGDDHGNTIASATLMSVPSSKTGVINTGTDVDYFKFTLTSTRTVTLRTTGSVDTYGTLYKADGSYVTEADDTGSDLNFTITRSLAAGTYAIAVEGYSSSDTGAFTLVAQ